MSASEVLLAESGTAASTIIITGHNSRELRWGECMGVMVL
jgi:hypothetical protein